ncbi:MAG: hypothetical protein Q4C81_08530 [Kocuria sp.]|nr:hypothetical protein [Kocuria sp.]
MTLHGWHGLLRDHFHHHAWNWPQDHEFCIMEEVVTSSLKHMSQVHKKRFPSLLQMQRRETFCEKTLYWV